MKLTHFKKLTLLISCIIASYSISAQKIWIVSNGSDANPGTKEKPLKTLKVARYALRASSAKGEHEIILWNGDYFISKIIESDKLNSGTLEVPYMIASYCGERARLIGGA